MTATALKSTLMHTLCFKTIKRSIQIIATVALLLIARNGYSQVINTYPYNENFETFTPLSVSNSCGSIYSAVANGWEQDTLDDGNWNADFGGTSTYSTGPGATPSSSGNGVGTDFNPGTLNGIYLYTETNGCYYSTINLLSPYCNFSANSIKLKFAYHMFGSTMGSLHVDIYQNGVWDLDVWTKSGNQGTNWNQATVNLSAYTSDSVRVRLRAITGSSYYSDMAIDDVSLIALVPDDAGIVSLDEPITACPGNTNVVATLMNYGTNVLNSVTINWKINNVQQAPINYTQTLQPDSTVQLTLGPYNFQPSVVYDIVAFTSNPNGNTDNNIYNDSSSKLGFQTSMNGIYTIGGLNPDFATISDAANALNNNGVCGPVVFNIRTGTYTQQVELNSVLGTSSVNTITFQSESGDSTDVSMVYGPSVSTQNYTLRIWNTDFLTFRNMTISTTGVTYSILVNLNGGSDHVSFNNCVFNGYSGGSSSTLRTVIYSNTDIDNYFTFRNNRVEDGSYGLYLLGLNSTSHETGHIIENNIFNVFAIGVRLQYADSCIINNNTIISNQYSIYTGFEGIYLYYSNGPNQVNNNLIQALTGSYGIYMYNCAANSGNPGVIQNNMIYIGGSSSAYGIYMNGNTSNYNLYYNTVNCSSSYSYSRSLYVNTSTGSNLRFIDNVFSNLGGGIAFYANYPAAIVESDYNDIYSSGSFIGYWSGNQTDINNWRIASNMDANSLDFDPGFLGGVDLHVGSGGINNKGTPIAGITVDFDGETRNTTNPDIGADEFTPPPNDIGVIGFASPRQYSCDATDSTLVSLMIYNYGTAPQVNFDVRARIYQIQIGYETVTDTVYPGDTLVWTLSNTVDLSIPGLYPFSATTILASDANHLNDSIGHNLIESSQIIDQFAYVVNFENAGSSAPLYWLNDPADGTEDWNFNNTGSPYISAGPTADHTTGTSSGHYAWVDASFPYSQQVNLVSPCLDLSIIQNPFVEFYYWNSNTASSILLHLDVLEDGIWYQDIAGPLGLQSVTDWGYHLIDLNAFYGKVIKIRFRAEDRGLSTTADIAIDDIKVYNLGPFNTGVVKVLKPNNGCGLTDIEPVQIKIQSFGVDTLFPGTIIPVRFNINNGSANIENVTLTDTLAQFDTLYYTFNNTANLFNIGTYLLKAWTDMPLDDDFSNDTSIVEITNIPVIATGWPYYEDFENGNGGWVPDGNKSTWGLGTPSGATIIGAASGQNAYMTNLSGSYNNDEHSWVISPCFDFSTLNKPQIAMHLNWDLETSYDGAVLQYSTNAGQTWQNVGMYFDPVNWYNDNSLSGLPGGSLIGWSGTGANGGSQGWLSAKHSLDGLGGLSAVRLRIAFGSDASSNNYDGIAFDDIAIGETPNVNIGLGLDTIDACGFVTLDAGNPGAMYIWSNGKATQTITIIAGSTTTTNTYYVWVEMPTGLYNTDTVVVVLHPGPHVDLGQDVTACGMSSYSLNAGNPGSIFQWDDGSSAQNRIVTQSGTYWVNVTNNGCTHGDTINVSFEQYPDASFTVSVPTGSKTADFNNTSTNGNSYSWDFGDGFNSSQQNPTHTYTNAGTYTVTLIVTNDCGPDTFQTTVQINPTGIDALSGLTMFRIFPVPSNGQLMITLETAKALDLKLELLTIEGKLIRSLPIGIISGSYTHPMDLRNLAKGVYFIRLSGQGAAVMEKIILQ